MTITEKIESLKRELQESSSEQYREVIRSQIARLTNYLLTGSFSGKGN